MIIRPLTPFGVEIRQFLLQRADRDAVATLAAALADHGVAVLRDQNAGDDEFADFLSRLGPPMFTAGETPLPHQPALNLISNVGRERPPRSVFHTDTSYVSRPPAYTALKAVRLPAAGGETLFSDQYRAFATLPARWREPLREATVLHRATGVSVDADRQTRQRHPLCRRHPLSGKTALYLSTPQRCRALSGVTDADSERIIELLYRHSIRPRRLYRHRWRHRDVVIWDNRCTLHRADHSQVSGDRVLHRGLVEGEVPIAAGR